MHINEIMFNTLSMPHEPSCMNGGTSKKKNQTKDHRNKSKEFKAIQLYLQTILVKDQDTIRGVTYSNRTIIGHLYSKIVSI